MLVKYRHDRRKYAEFVKQIIKMKLMMKKRNDIILHSVCNIESSFDNLCNEENVLNKWFITKEFVLYFRSKICHEVLFKRKYTLYS